METRKKSLGRRIREEKTSYLMLLPNLIMFVVFTIYPILWTIRYCMFDYKGYGTPKFVGFANFARIARDTVFKTAIVNTFVYVGGKLLLTLPIAFMLAFLLSKNTRLNATGQSIIFTPTIMSSAVMALIFYLLFNTYNGEINRFLTWLGIIDENVNWLGVKYAMLTCIIIAATTWFISLQASPVFLQRYMRVQNWMVRMQPRSCSALPSLCWPPS